MTKPEIIEELQMWVSNNEFEPDRERFDALKESYEKLNEPAEKTVDEEEDPVPEKSAEDKRFDELVQIYHDKRKQHASKRKASLDQNLKVKKELLSELQELIQDEENIAKAYNRFNAIKQKWNECGPVPTNDRRDIQAEYSRLIELFYYNINIYRELKINDLKKNQELKLEVIEKIRQLEDEKSINQVDFLIHQYLDEWDEIGPTFREEWDKIREQFKSSVSTVFDRIREHRKHVKDEHQQNYERKKELVDRIVEISDRPLNDVKEVQANTKTVIDTQKEWKHIGYAGRSKNDSIWKEFRAACDSYFEKRNKFLEESNKEFAEVKERKRALIDRAKEIHAGENSGEIANELKRLQREWKQAGKLLPQEEYKLFKEFRSYCDKFFNRKKEQAKELEKQWKTNLHKKEELIVKFSEGLEAKLEKEGEKLIDLWKKEWNEVGDVPSRLNDKVEKAFENVLNKAYKALGISKSEIAQKAFDDKLEILTGRDDAEGGLQDERRAIQRQIKEAESNVIQLEDKLAFFKYSDDTNPLKKELLDRIEDAKGVVEQLRAKRKRVDLTIKGIRQEEEETVSADEASEQSDSE